MKAEGGRIIGRLKDAFAVYGSSRSAVAQETSEAADEYVSLLSQRIKHRTNRAPTWPPVRAAAQQAGRPAGGVSAPVCVQRAGRRRPMAPLPRLGPRTDNRPQPMLGPVGG